jgi:hypothetical protein
MRFRLAFWMRDHPKARPGDVVDVPDHLVPALVKAGIGRPAEGAGQAPVSLAKAQPVLEPAEQPE